jgi:2-desacetyl-2-hydroxyethyl bacteriochlorophyllide A dehydrogenase
VKALYIVRPGQVDIREIDTPAVGPDEVLVRVRAAGICGTDLHMYDGGWVTTFPLIPGHEFAGEIAARGSEVKGLAVGQPVAVNPCLYCGTCMSCREGRFNFCEGLKVYGDALPGGFAEYVAVTHSCIHPCGGLSLEEASVIEPISCGVHALSRAGRVLGGKVLLFGCGTQGLILLQLARLNGAGSVTAVDRYRGKLALAEKMGATRTFLADDSLEKNLSQAGPFDLLIDATGQPRVIEGLVRHAGNGATLLYFGVCPPDAAITVRPFEVFRRELKIYGSFSLSGDFETALRLAQSGVIDVKSLITHRLPLSEFVQGLHFMRSASESAKILILP